MTYLVERLAELHSYLRHAEELRQRGVEPSALKTNLTLRNDVVHTLLTLAQLVIDIAGELNARRGERFENYRTAIRKLAKDPAFSTDLVDRLEPIAGFRNVVVHEYATIDYGKVVEALHDLGPIAEFASIVQSIEAAF